MQRRLRQPHQVPLVLCACILTASCGIVGLGEDGEDSDLDVDAIPGDYSSFSSGWEIYNLAGCCISFTTPDPANVFELEFSADGGLSGHITIQIPEDAIEVIPTLESEFAALLWGGPPPFDSPVSGTWEVREGVLDLVGTNINFLNQLHFDLNGEYSIRTATNVDFSFGDGECLRGDGVEDFEVDGVAMAKGYFVQVTLCKKGAWQDRL